jgi:hypothetical protein
MLSYFLLKKAKEKAKTWEQMAPTYSVEKLFVNDPITLSLGDAIDYFADRKECDRLWNDCELPKQTIHYEDMFHGVGIPALNLFLDMNRESSVKKTQYEKSKLFKNYEEIRGFVECCA